MELNENADLDTSQVEDLRGGGGGGGGGGLGNLPIGGGGLAGIVVTVLIALVGGYFGINNLNGGGSGSEPTVQSSALQQECADTNQDRLKELDCRNVLYINSIQAYWVAELPDAFGKQYKPSKTRFFSNQVRTGCGAADSGTGPFYCPADDYVYIDLTFYKLLADQLGAPGEFAQPYVLAHEYGHHVQDLLGTEASMRREQERDPSSANKLSVSLELQADCYAGAWAKGASSTKSSKGVQLFTSITDSDIQEGLTTASKIGDDTLQKRSGGTVNPAEFTHGTSAQRQQWFRTGYDSGDPKKCDTFAAGAIS